MRGVRRKENHLQLFTIGYQTKKVDEVVLQLKASQVEILCDVRRNPVSRKPGFSKKRLADSLSRAGIEYRHFPALGISSAQRRMATDRLGREKLLSDYQNLQLQDDPEAIRATTEILHLIESEKNVALLCFEADLNQCHRKPLAEHLSARFQHGLTIHHL